MGLDVQIAYDNYEEIQKDITYDQKSPNSYYKMCLSRHFCNLLFRKDSISHRPELDQIQDLTGINISPLYEMMENYPEDENLEENEVLENSVQNNISRVLKMIEGLIKELSNIHNLPKLLLQTELDTLWNEGYFCNFNEDEGDGYIGNNFGQDLRNFRHSLLFAIERGSKTVWFHIE